MPWPVLARSGCPTLTTSTVAPITTSQSLELIAPCPSTRVNLLHTQEMKERLCPELCPALQYL